MKFEVAKEQFCCCNNAKRHVGCRRRSLRPYSKYGSEEVVNLL